ncbi:type II toxin-antitoxin system RelE family toxin [Sporolituus thermophilus]|uniref:mRNA interferase RelE/StbE n=1 Tax=Sporolituus thermophilus DSM 23256 TaxID=1123285 RepID=A0A1G7JXQ7_9FIRM|nr:type II toxin-antitoxin system RelE/ParE family toxin [Sporolituus thermophilus]SDF29604.1 mRNA interferase RelE/StbE [Sporolituus thermophilus DSM 23256]
MKKWKVQISDRALKELKKLDAVNREMILIYLETRIEGSSDPRRYGEPLKGNLSGYWRYRIGQYHILCELADEIVTVYVVTVGHKYIAGDQGFSPYLVIYSQNAFFTP